jgi:dynein light chain LC8-type
MSGPKPKNGFGFSRPLLALPTDIRAALPRLFATVENTSAKLLEPLPCLPQQMHLRRPSPTGASKAVIRNVDMSEETQAQVIAIVTYALEQHTVEKDIAAYIKRECDKKFNPTWHVVVGRNFGSYVTHGTHSLLSSDLYAKGVTRPVAESNIRLTWFRTFLAFSETRHFIYFYVGVLSFLIWKS